MDDKHDFPKLVWERCGKGGEIKRQRELEITLTILENKISKGGVVNRMEATKRKALA